MAIFFEWDPEKARKNLRDHGISFAAATRVFKDAYRITQEDLEIDGEQRWRTIGIADGVAIVLVIHLEDVWENDVYVRMISAREATPVERSDYEQSRTFFDG